MAFRVILVATLVAYASAGMSMEMMQYMQTLQAMQNMHAQVKQPDMPCAGPNCAIPHGVDIEQYMEQQKREQRYKSEQVATEIKEQFETVMNEVRMKKHRYAMGIMTEFTSMCACMKSEDSIYKALFIPHAVAANMTVDIDMRREYDGKPYEAGSLKEAKERIFGGMLMAICNSLGTYMEFVDRVEQELDILNPSPVTNAPGGSGPQ